MPNSRRPIYQRPHRVMSPSPLFYQEPADFIPSAAPIFLIVQVHEPMPPRSSDHDPIGVPSNLLVSPPTPSQLPLEHHIPPPLPVLVRLGLARAPLAPDLGKRLLHLGLV